MAYEVEFLPVGDSNGDAIVIRYGSPLTGYTIHVVDGGYVDTGQTIVSHIDRYYGARKIDHVVVTHSDNDHTGGLVDVVNSFEIGAIWMNLPWRHLNEVIEDFDPRFTREGLWRRLRTAYPYLVDLERIATLRGIPVLPAFAGTRIGAFTVLAPSRPRYISLIRNFSKTPKSHVPSTLTRGLAFGSISPQGPLHGLAALLTDEKRRYREDWIRETLTNFEPETAAVNESSVVQLGVLDGQHILLTGDAGPIALNEAATVADTLGLRTKYPDLVQVPHHGSRRNVTPAVLDRWIGGVMQAEGSRYGWAVCSVGARKPEYPRRRVANAFARRGYPVLTMRKITQSFTLGVPMRPRWGPGTPMPFAFDFVE